MHKITHDFITILKFTMFLQNVFLPFLHCFPVYMIRGLLSFCKHTAHIGTTYRQLHTLSKLLFHFSADVCCRCPCPCILHACLIISLGQIPRSGITGSKSKHIFKTLKVILPDCSVKSVTRGFNTGRRKFQSSSHLWLVSSPPTSSAAI